MRPLRLTWGWELMSLGAPWVAQRVPHAHGAVQVCPAVELVGQHLKPPLGLVDGQGASLSVEHCHPGGVVPTILQPGQPFQQNGSGLFPSDVAYNSAHF